MVGGRWGAILTRGWRPCLEAGPGSAYPSRWAVIVAADFADLALWLVSVAPDFADLPYSKLIGGPDFAGLSYSMVIGAQDFAERSSSMIGAPDFAELSYSMVIGAPDCAEPVRFPMLTLPPNSVELVPLATVAAAAGSVVGMVTRSVARDGSPAWARGPAPPFPPPRTTPPHLCLGRVSSPAREKGVGFTAGLSYSCAVVQRFLA